MSKKIRKNPNRAPKKPKERSQKKKILWITLLCVLFVAICLSALFAFLHFKYNGWKTIRPETIEGGYSEEVELKYLLGEKGTKGKADLKAIQSIFNDTLNQSYQVLSDSETFEDIINLKTLSSNENSSYFVSPLLYQTLKTMTQSENRILYYAPIFAMYEKVFAATSDDAAKALDPQHNPELQRAILRLMPYIMSEEHIRVEFLEDEDYLLCLYVSDDYLAELSYFGIEEKISLGTLELAFAVDFIADALVEAGYTNGVVTSYNGYARNLGLYGTSVSTDIYVKGEGVQAQSIGEFSYKGARSIVSYHNYPITTPSQKDFYLYGDGTLVSPYFNLGTGLSEGLAVDEMLFYSKEISCARLALMTYSYFVNPSLMGNDINDLTTYGIYTVYTLDGTVFYNDVLLVSDADLKLTKSGYMKSYLYN